VEPRRHHHLHARSGLQPHLPYSRSGREPLQSRGRSRRNRPVTDSRSSSPTAATFCITKAFQNPRHLYRRSSRIPDAALARCGLGRSVCGSRAAAFVRQGTLFAQDFDAARLELRGNASPVGKDCAECGARIGSRLRIDGRPIRVPDRVGQRPPAVRVADRSGKDIGKAGDRLSAPALNFHPMAAAWHCIKGESKC
jgi:hypothetical protein